MNEKVVNAILSYGNRYREEMLLKCYTKEQLLDNWWEASKFFFHRAFYQARNDNVSSKVCKAAMDVLEPELSIVKDCLEKIDWDILKNALQEKIGKGKVGKARDIEMTISALQFVQRLPNLNIVAYSVQRIKANEINEHYKELQKSKNKNGIVQVGPKVSSLYLRDVVSLFQLENYVPNDFQFCLQPIDVWVRKLSVKIGIVQSGQSDEQIRDAIVEFCQKKGCSPSQFNQGVWYAGRFAFDLLLENLETHGV